MHQVVVLEVGRYLVERREQSCGTLGLANSDGSIERDHRRGQEREQVIVQGDDLRPVSGFERPGLAVHGLDGGLELEGSCLVAADTGPYDRVPSSIMVRSHLLRS